MKASEQLLASRILTVVLSVMLITLAVILYNQYLPGLLIKAEQILAASMGDLDTIVASR